MTFKGKRGCYLAQDGKAQFRELDTGDMIAEQVIVNKGLSNGDEVIVLGASGLVPGDPVSVPVQKGPPSKTE